MQGHQPPSDYKKQEPQTVNSDLDEDVEGVDDWSKQQQHIKFLEGRARDKKMAQMQLVARSQNESALVDEEMQLIVKRVEKSKAKKQEARQKLEEAFGTDVANMKLIGARARNRNLCQLMFCFVIMGCELDFIGFFGAFMMYWNLEIFIVQALLVAMPGSFILCVTMYFCIEQPKEEEKEEKAKKEIGSAKSMAQKAKRLLNRTSVRLSWYHFLPLARYVLLIKSITPEDVEGIFRVNSLSSFTLGSCQVVGLLFTIMENGNSVFGLSMFVYMNMFSQLVNWTITLLYFSTSIATNMRNAIASGAYSANLSLQMRKTLVQLQVSISEDAERFADEEVNVIESLTDELQSNASVDNDGYLSNMRMELEKEVSFFKKAKVSFRYFDPIELLQIRRAVYTQFAEELDQ